MPDKRIIFNQSELHPHYMRNQTQKIPVGWCNHNKHRGKMSIKQMKSHECLKKQCPFFTKNPRHCYWEQKAQIKENKRVKKFEARFSDILKEEIKKELDRVIPKEK